MSTTRIWDADRVTEIFADAWTMHNAALACLEAGDIRDAAEKAWCATKRATDALILARTGDEPRTAGQTMRGIRTLRRNGPPFDQLAMRYGDRASSLHGACFYDGNCEPEDIISKDIQETAQYVNDAEALANQ